MASGSAIEFSFGVNLAGLQSGATKAQAIVARMSGGIKKSSALAFAGRAGAAAFGLSKLASTAEDTASKVRGVFDFGATIQALSERTGASAGRLYQMGKALKSVDVDVEKLAPSINRLQVRLSAAANGSKPVQEAFEGLGLNFANLLRLSPDQQFNAVARTIGALQNPAARSAAAVALFGRAGAELLPFFNNADAIASAGGALSSQALVFQQSSKQFQLAAVNIRRAGNLFQGFYVGMAGAIAGRLNQVFASFKMPDFVGLGRMVGNLVAGLLPYLARIPDYFRIAAFSLSSGVMSAIGYAGDLVNLLWNGAREYNSTLVAGWWKVASIAAEVSAGLIKFAVPLGIKVYSGLKWAFENVLQFFGNKFWDLIAQVSAGIQFALQGALKSVFDGVPASMRSMLGIGAMKTQSLSQIQASSQGMMDGFKTGFHAHTFDQIEQGVSQSIKAAVPGVAAAIGFLEKSATDSAGKAAAAWQKVSQKGDLINTAGFHKMADNFDAAARKALGSIGAPLPLLSALNTTAQALMRSVPSRMFQYDYTAPVGGGTALSLGVHGGLDQGAYGSFRSMSASNSPIRSASRARQVQAEAAAKNASKTNGVEGTNTRLDKMSSQLEKLSKLDKLDALDDIEDALN